MTKREMDGLECEEFDENLSALLITLSRDIAEQLRRKRSERGYSQADLAGLLKTKQSRISQVEDPNYGKLSLTTLAKLAVCMNCDLKIELVDRKWELENAPGVCSETDLKQSGFEYFYQLVENATTRRNDQLNFQVIEKESHKLIETLFLKGEEKGQKKWVV